MQNVDINLAALAVAAAANMLIGFMWYSKALFGKAWMKFVGLTNKDIASGDKLTPMLTMLILAFVQVFVLLHFITYSAYFYPEYSDFAVGLLTAVWVWVGFVFPVMAGAYMFAQRRKKLLAIDAGYSLAALVAAGVILAVWG